DAVNPLASLRRLKVKGIKENGQPAASFINNNLAAGRLGRIELRNAQFDNDGQPFGLTAHALDRISHRDASGSWTWPATVPPDMVIRYLQPTWRTVNDFVYQLQNVDLAAMGQTQFDLAVIDYSQDGSDAMRFTAEQVNALKNSPGGPKLVLAYMSIGEAEDYRWYWQESWDADHDGQPDPGAPTWLGPSNPEWPGNYKVRYWEPGWQSLIYGAATSYLDKIIVTGYDGVYLDIIDAYEYWGPGGESGLNRPTAEQEIVDFVKALAQYARVTQTQPTFGVFPQNAEPLSAHPDYVQAVTGIGKEDLWYRGNTRQPASYTQEAIADLDIFEQAGKPVLVIDYVRQSGLIGSFYSKATARGYVPYATLRPLDKLILNPGHRPD
ncbi:MAG: hypothetical protein FJ272_20510, partial [Planctomycetes bacterium]|nr:hypothetical protein [Planctomycetota bacterium]